MTIYFLIPVRNLHCFAIQSKRNRLYTQMNVSIKTAEKNMQKADGRAWTRL